MVDAAKDSLRLLGLDYVDMLLVHWPINTIKEGNLYPEKIPMYKVYAQFEECAKLGLTKHVGVSNFSVQLLLDLFTYCEYYPACNQIELHPYLQ